MGDFERRLYMINNEELKKIVRFQTKVTAKTNFFKYHVLKVLEEVWGYQSIVFWDAHTTGVLYNPVTRGIPDAIFDQYLKDFHEIDLLHPQNYLNKIEEHQVVLLYDQYDKETIADSRYMDYFMTPSGYIDEMAINLVVEEKLIGTVGVIRSSNEEKFKELDKQRFEYIVTMITNLLIKKEKNIVVDGYILLKNTTTVEYINRAAMVFLEQYELTIEILLHYYHLGEKKIYLYREKENVYLEINLESSEMLEREASHYLFIHFKEVRDIYIKSELTLREREVCEYLAQGHSYKEIANHLFISVNTVKKHIQNIYRKYEVSDYKDWLISYLNL